MAERLLFTLVFLLLLAAVIALLRRLAGRNDFSALVHEWEHGLLYVDGRFEGVLPAGRYWTLPFGPRREIHRVVKRQQYITTAPVDATSADRLPVRLSAHVIFRVSDPRTAFEALSMEFIRLTASSALVTLAAGRSLDELLGERAPLEAGLLAAFPAPIGGCVVESVMLAGVTLPPEIRRMISEAERARLEGLAALERARGEHAALRSLANAARMLKGNPELMNLRVLQALSAPGSRGQSMLVMSPTGLVPVPAEAAGDAPTA